MVHHQTCQEKGISISTKGVRERKESAIFFIIFPYVYVQMSIQHNFWWFHQTMITLITVELFGHESYYSNIFASLFAPWRSQAFFFSFSSSSKNKQSFSPCKAYSNIFFLYDGLDFWWGSHLHFKGMGHWNYMQKNRILAIQSISSDLIQFAE